jgi:hypothetical protein
MSLKKIDKQILIMKKLCFTFLILMIITPSIMKGQNVTRQAGLRTGYRGGFFYQATTEAGNAEVGYNVMLGFSNNGIQLTGLRIVYESSLSNISPGLYFAWGYGGHAGFFITDHLRSLGENYSFQGERFCPVFGADGWLAAEYRLRNIPINISLNIRPFVELTLPSFVRIIPGDPGVSISYVF